MSKREGERERGRGRERGTERERERGRKTSLLWQRDTRSGFTTRGTVSKQKVKADVNIQSGTYCEEEDR